MNGPDLEPRPIPDDTYSNEGVARSMYLAMLGAVGMVWDGWDDTVNRLIQRGEELQGELQSRAQESRWESMRSPSRVSDSMQMLSRTLRDQLDIPSKAELDAMNVKLNILLRKMDDLAMRSGGGAGAPDVPVAPPPQEPSGSDEIT